MALPRSMYNPKHFFNLCQSFWCKQMGSCNCLSGPGCSTLVSLLVPDGLSFNATLIINSGVRRPLCLHELCCSHCSDIFLLAQLLLKNNCEIFCLVFSQFHSTMFVHNDYISLFHHICFSIVLVELRMSEDKKVQNLTDRVKKKALLSPMPAPYYYEKTLVILASPLILNSSFSPLALFISVLGFCFALLL